VYVSVNANTLVTGDSIGLFGDIAGGLHAQMQAQRKLIRRSMQPGKRVAGAGGSVLTPSAMLSQVGFTQPQDQSFSVPGRVIAGLAADQVNSIQVFNPDIVIPEIVVNDIGNSTPIGDPFTPGTFMGDYANVLDTTKAWKPSVKFICMGTLTRFEQWSSTGGVNNGPRFLTAATPGNAWDNAIRALCAARSDWCEFAEQISWALAMNVQLNTPEPGVNAFLTVDGIHPTAATQVLMGSQLLTHIQFGP
jgi:hypothetical protein